MAKLREISTKFMLTIRGGREDFVPYMERHIKAIITSEQVSLQRRRLKQVNGNQEEKKAVAKDKDPLSKFVVADVALAASCNLLSVLTLELATEVCPVSRIIKSQNIGRKIAHLRNLKCRVTTLTTWAQEMRILDDDGVTRGDGNDDLQIMSSLKGYFMQVDGTLTNLTKLRRCIGKLEDHLYFQLENHLNHLIRLLLFWFAGVIYFTIYWFVAGIDISCIWKRTWIHISMG